MGAVRGASAPKWSLRTAGRFLAVAVCLASCSENGPTGPGYGAPVALQMIAGNAQSGLAHDELAAPLAVEVLDARGRRVPMAAVAWSLATGEGTLSPESALSTELGVARATLRFGAAIGAHTVLATLSGAEPVEFTVTALRRPAQRLEIVAGDHQEEVVGREVPDSLVVRALDDRGTAVPGVSVQFSAFGGLATLSPANVVTDAEGLARTAVTFGAQAGGVAIFAQAAGVDGAAFSLQALEIPVAYLDVLAGDGQVGVVDTYLADSIRVRLRAADGAPLVGRLVCLSASSPVVSCVEMFTNGEGVAAGRWHLGWTAGPVTIGVFAGDTSVTVTATALAGPITWLTVLSGEKQEALPGEPLAAPIVVRARDMFQNPAAGVTLTVAPNATSGTLTPDPPITDAAGELHLDWRLGTAYGLQQATVTAPSGQSLLLSAAAVPAKHDLGHVVVDADFHRPTGRLITVSQFPNQLHLIDAVSRLTQTVSLPSAPRAVGVSPDGTRAAVGHDGWVSIVDLVTPQVLVTHTTSLAVVQVLWSPNGKVYLAPDDAVTWGPLTALDPVTGAMQPGDATIRGVRRGARLHPSGSSIYAVTWADFEKHDVSGVAPVRLYDSRYIGQHGMNDVIYMSDDGRRLFSRTGAVFETAPVEADDIRYLTTMDTVASAHWIGENAAAALAAVFNNNYPVTNPTGLSEVRFFENQFYEPRGRVLLPSMSIDGTPVPGLGRFGFFSEDGSLLHVLQHPDQGSLQTRNWGLVTFPLSAIP